jgi:hypothetical protein
MPLREITSIGLRDLEKLSLDSDTDDTPCKKSRNVKIEISNKDFVKFVGAVQELANLSTDGNFYDAIRKIKGRDMSILEIQNTYIHPILNILYKEKKQKKGTHQSNFFTKKHQTTDEVRLLFSEIKSRNTNLRYNPEEYTCITDVKSLFATYMKEQHLVDSDCYNVDDFMRSVAPKTLENVDRIANQDYRSLSINIAKEMINWESS